MAIFDINDGFSRNRRRPETQNIPDIAELQTEGPRNGYFARFLRPLLPNNALINLQKRPTLSQDAKNAIRDARARNDDTNRAREAEDVVLINGFRLPGIFQGFSISGGIITEKFEKGRGVTVKKIKLAKGTELFQVDKGVKPFSGRGRFILLDDEHSDSLSKSTEFIRIVTDWLSGENGQLTGIPRVFKMESFLSGHSPSVPFFFHNIKIVDYGMTLGNGMEGRIDAFFAFEQFELLKREKEVTERPFKPKSEIKAPNSEVPDVVTSEVNEITFPPFTIQGG